MPTVVFDTIGALGTYPDLAAWNAATRDLDLVGLDQIREGRLLDDVYELAGGAESLALLDLGPLGTRSSTQYRRLRNDPSVSRYLAWQHAGPRFYVQWAATSGNQYGIDIQDPHFRMDGVGIIGDDINVAVPGLADIKALVRVRAPGVKIQRTWAICEDGGDRDEFSTIGPFFYCFWVNGEAGSLAEDVLFYNCSARGSRFQKGASFGFYFDAFSAKTATGVHGCWNCAAYEFSRGLTTRAYFSSAASPAVGPSWVNCVGAGTGGAPGTPSDFGGPVYRYANNVSEDGSALAAFSGGLNGLGELSTPDPGSKGYLNPNALWVRPGVRDNRLKVSSSLRAAGLDDRATLLQALSGNEVLQDADGNPRGEVWSIGPYESTAEPPSTPPIETVYSIGSAPGRDYPDKQAFLDATENLHLFDRNEIIIGEVYDDGLGPIDIGTDTLRARRTVADGTRRRILRAASDDVDAFNRWVPHLARGVHIRSEGSGGQANLAVLDIQEPYFAASGMKLENDYAGTSSRRVVRVRAPFVRLDAIEVEMSAGTGSSNLGIECEGDLAVLTNILVRGSATPGQGLTRGIQFHDCQRSRAIHCVSDQVNGNNATNYGFHEGLRADLCVIENSIGTAAGSAAFFHETPTDSFSTQSHNVSDDATADGPSSKRSISRATIWNDPDIGDYRLVAGSPALDFGKNVARIIDTDFAGNRRLFPADVGIYEGILYSAIIGPRFVRDDLAELCTLWEIIRPDGQGFFFTDANEPIDFKGRRFVPTNGVNASARQSQSGLNEGSVSLDGAISSDAITNDDLRSHKFDGSRVTEYVVDWRYPFANPTIQNVYFLDRTRETGEVWSGDFVGIENRLDRVSGENITVGCELELGGPGCFADITADIQSDVRVDTVIDSRLRFTADAADIPGSYPDDFFGNGDLIWLEGNLAGTKAATVKSYTAATREIELEWEAPLTIQVGDTFLIKPGCRRRYLEDCVGKFANGRNNGGHPHIPPATDALEAPRR